MSDKRIAGHNFSYTAIGRRCILTDCNGRVCGISWLMIRSCTALDLGQTGFAHVGALNDEELRSIVDERTREETVVWEAVHYAASSGSR